jgi:hypothetical protein
MTVEQLIEHLRGLPRTAEVFVENTGEEWAPHLAPGSRVDIHRVESRRPRPDDSMDRLEVYLQI